MHLVSYLGYLLGVYGKDCSYVIVSGDKDYDNIVKFWKAEGYHISRRETLIGNISAQKKTTQSDNQAMNREISIGMAHEFKGEDRSKLNLFMQHAFIDMGYDRNTTNKICKRIIAHCNDAKVLEGIHNELMKDFTNCADVYEDVKLVLLKFVRSKNN